MVEYARKGIFLSIIFLIEKRSPFHSLKLSPMSRIGGILTVSKRPQRNPHCLHSYPLGVLSGMLLRNNITLLEAKMTSIQDGPRCIKKGTKQFQSSQMSSIPCAPRWVSKTLNDTWFSSTTTVYIDTSRQKWSF
jgi:hypothetical protein